MAVWSKKLEPAEDKEHMMVRFELLLLSKVKEVEQELHGRVVEPPDKIQRLSMAIRQAVFGASESRRPVLLFDLYFR
jgi:hypothetical protein